MARDLLRLAVAFYSRYTVTMRQIWISKAGPPEVLQIQSAPDPLPRSGEVRIRVEASGVSFLDILGRLGTRGQQPRIPFVPGLEVAGTIDAVAGGAPNLKEGDRVIALTRYGGYCDVICVPHRQVFKRFDWMSAEQGAALPVNYLTAYVMLVVMGSLRPGDKVLIHSAAGGVGLAALDICRIIGAETYGTASPHKHDFLLERGLGHPIDYRNQDYERVLMDLTGGRGVQVVLDPFGGTHWPKNYRLLMPTGRLIHYGLGSLVSGKSRSRWTIIRNMVVLPFYTPLKLMRDNRSVAGVNLHQLWGNPDLLRTWMDRVLTWYDEALFRPYVGRVFRLEQVAAAHHHLQDRQNFGKVILLP